MHILGLFRVSYFILVVRNMFSYRFCRGATKFFKVQMFHPLFIYWFVIMVQSLSTFCPVVHGWFFNMGDRKGNTIISLFKKSQFIDWFILFCSPENLFLYLLLVFDWIGHWYSCVPWVLVHAGVCSLNCARTFEVSYLVEFSYSRPIFVSAGLIYSVSLCVMIFCIII